MNKVLIKNFPRLDVMRFKLRHLNILITQDSVNVRYNCYRQQQSIPERMLDTEDTPHGVLFFPQNWPFGQRTVFAATTDSKHAVSSAQAGYRSDC